MTEISQLYVICDTNAAARDAFLFLKKGGPELIAMLRAKQAKLLVPEVVLTEYITHFANVWADAVGGAKPGLDKLEDLTGYKMKEFLPAPEYGEARASEILAQLADVIQSIPLTDELMLAAGRRSMIGAPPTSKKDHGFKDCLIWESILTLPAGSEVLFVSRDKLAFFDGESLAPVLRKDAEAKGIKITAFNTAKSQSLWPLVNALKARFSDIADLAPEDVPMGDHPLIRAYAKVAPAALLVTQEEIAKTSKTTIANANEIELELVGQTRQLLDADIKALGFVTYLKSFDKRTIVDMLERSGISTDVARNALDRLTLAGLIKDTGNHYLAVDGHLAGLTASQVELEVIAFFEQGDE
jgi:hypothetical protein